MDNSVRGSSDSWILNSKWTFQDSFLVLINYELDGCCGLKMFPKKAYIGNLIPRATMLGGGNERWISHDGGVNGLMLLSWEWVCSLLLGWVPYKRKGLAPFFLCFTVLPSTMRWCIEKALTRYQHLDLRLSRLNLFWKATRIGIYDHLRSICL